MSPSLPLVTTAERRHRLGRRHRLAPSARATSAAQAADAVVALHATDAATVFLSARARLSEGDGPAEIEKALYEDVSHVRLLSMRNTLFAVSTGLAPYVDASTARSIAAKERRTLLEHLAKDGQGLDAAWLAQAEADALAALDAQGASTGSQISAAVPALRQKITIGRGKKYETEAGVATRVIRLLAADGRIRRDRPRGSWTSSHFRWVHTEPWPALPAAEARAEIARRWLHAYGPATEADLRWWTGWTLTDVRKALAAAGADQVRLDDGSTALVSPGDTAPEPAPEPWVALLPGLDPAAWTGPTAASTSTPRTGRPSSTTPATSDPPSGGTARSSAAGHSAPAARSSGVCWPTPAEPPRRPSPPRPSASPSGWARPASPRDSVPRSNANSWPEPAGTVRAVLERGQPMPRQPRGSTPPGTGA
ncbi:hypothetical protein EES37_08245 [Streptomyces sp. ADI91-18]|nr:hypothetical protein EES37_08245 [Streptomyces sp. ADI91-18]